MIYPSYYGIIPVYIVFLIIYNGNENNLLKGIVLSTIGNVSYSIYILHFPLLHICNTSTLIYFLILHM